MGCNGVVLSRLVLSGDSLVTPLRCDFLGFVTGLALCVLRTSLVAAVVCSLRGCLLGRVSDFAGAFEGEDALK